MNLLGEKCSLEVSKNCSLYFSGYRWASGPSMDGMGHFEYIANPVGTGQVPELEQAPSYIHGTPKKM